ncbi:MAG: 2Fe-2S iron-sulfur cluster binding domain-containing protein [Pseudomonadota bacterium]
MVENILTASIIGGSVAGILGVILILVDKFVADYGSCEIKINADKIITVEGGKNLLETLQEEKIFIPSSCGAKGSCGLCKVKINEGGGDILPTEIPHLTKSEMQSNIRLACQVKVRRDLEISLPEWILNLKPRFAKVIEINDLNYDTKSIVLDPEEPLKFIPGQYIQIQIPKTQEYRAYSIASSTREKNIELIIRQVPGGLCSTYIHEQLTLGDELGFLGPCGDFTFKTDSGNEIILIAGGSGLAVMKSILKWCFENGIERRITLFFGAVAKDDLFLMDELTEWEKKYNNFTFIPALSNPAHHDVWSGERGLITEVVERNISDASNKEAYLCGSPNMIDAAVTSLKKIGFPDENIFCDRFS